MSLIKFAGNARFKFRYDTTENWETANPVLYAGEIGVEQLADGSSAVKIGDGTATWSELAYAVDAKYDENSLRAQSGKAVSEALGSLKQELQEEFGNTLETISAQLDLVI